MSDIDTQGFVLNQQAADLNQQANIAFNIAPAMTAEPHQPAVAHTEQPTVVQQQQQQQQAGLIMEAGLQPMMISTDVATGMKPAVAPVMQQPQQQANNDDDQQINLTPDTSDPQSPPSEIATDAPRDPSVPEVDTDGQTVTRNIFVSGLGPTISDAQLSELCSAYGACMSAKVMLDIYTGKSRGYGFVLFKTEKEAFAAKRGLQHKLIDNRRLSIEFSRHDATHMLQAVPNVYIRNLPMSVSKEDIMAAINAFGEVVNVDLVSHGTTGTHRVIYVEYAENDSAAACVDKMHNTRPWSGCEIPVMARLAEPAKQRAERKGRHRGNNQNQDGSQRSSRRNSRQQQSAPHINPNAQQPQQQRAAPPSYKMSAAAVPTMIMPQQFGYQLGSPTFVAPQAVPLQQPPQWSPHQSPPGLGPMFAQQPGAMAPMPFPNPGMQAPQPFMQPPQQGAGEGQPGQQANFAQPQQPPMFMAQQQQQHQQPPQQQAPGQQPQSQQPQQQSVSMMQPPPGVAYPQQFMMAQPPQSQ